MLEQNFGVSYSPEKIKILFVMLIESGWTQERFQRTLKWFLKTKFNQAWTISDWFGYDVKVYPYSWYLRQVHENGREVNAEIEIVYLPEKKIGYRYIGGDPLPFETKRISDIH